MVVVVAGMHRTGTSLISSILVSLGVNMGDKMLRATSLQPYGHWEDIQFYEMNKRILRVAGGTWRKPPPRSRIVKVQLPIEELIEKKSKQKKWGWKDPRNCLTLPLYHKHLTNPHYIKVIRDLPATAASLQRRHPGGSYPEWQKLYNYYYQELNNFLADKNYLVIRYEEITPYSIAKLNNFINGNGKIKEAMKRVKAPRRKT